MLGSGKEERTHKSISTSSAGDASCPWVKVIIVCVCARARVRVCVYMRVSVHVYVYMSGMHVNRCA